MPAKRSSKRAASAQQTAPKVPEPPAAKKGKSTKAASPRQRRLGGRKTKTATTPFEKFAEDADEFARSKGLQPSTVSRYEELYAQMDEFARNYDQSEVDEDHAQQLSAAKSPLPSHEIDIDEEECSVDSTSPTTMDPDFPNAFQGSPKPCTDFALFLFLYHKCGPEDSPSPQCQQEQAPEAQKTHRSAASEPKRRRGKKKCGRASLEQAHAAAKWHYDYLQGGTWRGNWRVDPETQKCYGNPATSPRVLAMLRSLKNLHADDPRNHSRALPVEDMELMHQFRQERLTVLSGKTDLASRRERAELLLFGALSSIAWLGWLRCSEVTHLRIGDVNMSPPKRRRANGSEFVYLILNLHHRKNWTRKGENELYGHTYLLFNRPDQPAINAYAAVKDWLAHYENDILHRPLQPDDVLFPPLTASLSAPNQELTEDAVKKMTQNNARKAGVAHWDQYKTHCYRRGGAQYRFMFAPLGERWTLKRIRWWGGWSVKEHGDTLVKYLLDELFTYEEDHSAALQPDDNGNTTDLKGSTGRSDMEPMTGGAGRQLLSVVNQLSQELREARAFAIQQQQLLYRRCGTVGLSLGQCHHPMPYPPNSLPYQPAPLQLQDHNRQIPSRHDVWPQMPLLWPAMPGDPQSCSGHQQHRHSYHPYQRPKSQPQPPPTSFASNFQLPTLTPSGLPPAAPIVTTTIQPCAPESATATPTSPPISRLPNDNSQLIAAAPTYCSGGLSCWNSDLSAPSTNTTKAPQYGPLGRLAIPTIDKAPAARERAWATAVDDWEGKDPLRCPIPLRDWKLEWLQGASKKMKYHTREVIAVEFIGEYKRNVSAFREGYPEHKSGLKALYKAITRVHQAKGIAQTRAKRTVG